MIIYSLINAFLIQKYYIVLHSEFRLSIRDCVDSYKVFYHFENDYL